MGVLNFANIKKTIYYLQRNGLRETWYAISERTGKNRKRMNYVFEELSGEALDAQRSRVEEDRIRGVYEGIDFSIVVPLYRTEFRFLKALIESVKAQTYTDWELILADATEDDSVQTRVSEILREEDGDRIRYVRLSGNRGISENTNEALRYVSRHYTGLLDHDDLLTPNALYEMAEALRKSGENGCRYALVYSDEDKCNDDATEFYEPNKKEKFNYDLILSNNYICHFLVMESGLIRSLQFRREYDGAQDYDLVLRAIGKLGIPEDPSGEALVGHVNKVLYHWRCHSKSTAENPKSKEYAYEAGKRALQSHSDSYRLSGQAVHLKHLGFYELRYPGGLFQSRKDVGAVGGPVIERGRIVGGRMDRNGKVYYKGLSVHDSGYLHRAVLTQDAYAIDIRNMEIREELQEVFEEITGVTYKTKTGSSCFDVKLLPEDMDYTRVSIDLCKAIRKRGYRILWCRRDG